MAFKPFLTAALACCLALPAFAGEMKIEIMDAYARSSAKSGAAFFTIMNHAGEDDRLVAAASDVSKRVELHTHTEDANGVMRMREIEGGIAVPANGSHALQRGGDHVMFMGLSEALPEGETITVTLTFEKAGDVTVDIPVDNDRAPQHMQGQGGNMGHQGGHATN